MCNSQPLHSIGRKRICVSGFPTPPLAGLQPLGLPDLAGMGLPGIMPPPFPPIPTASAINPFTNRTGGLVSYMECTGLHVHLLKFNLQFAFSSGIFVYTLDTISCMYSTAQKYRTVPLANHERTTTEPRANRKRTRSEPQANRIGAVRVYGRYASVLYACKNSSRPWLTA